MSDKKRGRGSVPSPSPASSPTPPERHETIRREITSLIEDGPLSAKDISGLVGVREKEVYDHLEHIRKARKLFSIFRHTPAECVKCGFVFKKRERLKPPGRCPMCRGEAIEPPLFSITP
ncbi:MAG: transcriptional regulator [Thermodesulfobacteriota bacterium]